MRDALIAERMDDVYERVGVLVAGDVHERLGAAASGGDDVGEFDCRRDAFARVVHRRQRIETAVRHLGNTDVDVTLAFGGVTSAGHQLKQGRLAAGRETYESRAKHEPISLAWHPTKFWRKVGVTYRRSALWPLTSSALPLTIHGGNFWS